MTTLAAYLAGPEAKSLTALAAAIGISKGRLSQLRDSRDWPPTLALALERETDAAVSASDISPVIAAARQSPATTSAAA